MFISPKIAISEGWITGVDSNAHVQPNAIDFTLDRLYTIDESKHFSISENNKHMRGGHELYPDSENYWLIGPHTVNDGQSSMYVSIPENVAALLIVRSSFNRNGLFITSGLYDSGFKGHISFAIHNRSGEALIQQGTRIGQIIFVKSESAGLYAGGYNHEKGTHHTD